MTGLEDFLNDEPEEEILKVTSEGELYVDAIDVVHLLPPETANFIMTSPKWSFHPIECRFYRRQ